MPTIRLGCPIQCLIESVVIPKAKEAQLVTNELYDELIQAI